MAGLTPEPTLLDLDRQVRDSDAFRFRNLIGNSLQSWQMVRANAAELEAALKRFDGPTALKLWALDQGNERPALDSALLEVVRRLHNFLSAAVAVVDYTGRSVRFYRLRRPGFVSEHKERLNALHESSAFAFMKFLRNHGLHAGRHGLGAALHLGPSPQTRVFLETAPLRVAATEDRNSRRAAGYLASAPEEIDLRNLMKEYVGSVAGFLNWYHGEQAVAFEEADRDIAPIREQIQARSSRGVSAEAPNKPNTHRG